MKIFHAKKLCTDSKTLGEIITSEENNHNDDDDDEKNEKKKEKEKMIELSVMLLGGMSGILGAAGIGGAETKGPGAGVAAGPGPDGNGNESKKTTEAATLLQTDEFWTDLRTFLAQKLKSEDEVARTAETFRRAWASGQK